MSVTSALARGRVAAQALMVDTCTITYVVGTSMDPLTGDTVEQTATRYAGQCRIQQPQAVGERLDAGEVADVLLRLQLQLPVAGTEAVAREDVVTVTACASDAALVGRRFRVRDGHHKTHATARRLAIEEDT